MLRIIGSMGYEPTPSEITHNLGYSSRRSSLHPYEDNQVARGINDFNPSRQAPLISVRQDGFYFQSQNGANPLFLDTRLGGAVVIGRYVEATGRSPSREERRELKLDAKLSGRLKGIPDLSAREVYKQLHKKH